MTDELKDTQETEIAANDNAEQVEVEAIEPELVEPELVEPELAGSEKIDTSNLSDEIAFIAELKKKLAAAEQKVSDQKDSVIRAKAEMENVRRRAVMDVEKAHKFALDKFADGLLPVIDSMEMALTHADKTDENLKPMIEGVELTLKSMLTTMEKFGLTPVDPTDQAFNPEKHQAMSMQAVPGVDANQVIAVMQKGYELNGRLIRPAMVMVSKAAE